MFNFNELSVVHPNEPNRHRGSFVGIRKDKYLEKMAFTLPKGFDNFEINYENVKKLFFLMYRTFEKFRQNGKKYLDNRNNNKDNAQINGHQGAYVFIDEDNNETILYSKIDLIDKIFNTYQELEIESLIQELGLVEEVDYSRIENYLEKGIYLKNHAIFIESMVGYRNIVRGVPSELIELFCYIYKELAHELEQEVSEQIKEISFNFSYKYLSPEQSLFSEHSFEATIAVLKDCLNTIHKTTAYKNYQYWDIYEAVENFLYGGLEFDKDSQQGFWGINNFSYIWEEMCNYTVANCQEYKILYCDSTLPLNKYQPNLTKDDVWIDKDIITNNPFYLDFNGLKRWIRPDIIYKRNLQNNLSIMDIINIGVFSYEKKRDSSDLLALTSNIDVIFKFNQKYDIDNNLLLNFQIKFNEIYKYFSEKIFDILYPEENKGRGLKKKKTVKSFLKQLNIKKLDSNSFIVKSIPEKLFHTMLDNIDQEKNKISQKHIEITDWKYYSYNIFKNQDYRNNDRVNASIIKSLAYEFCLSQIIDEPINNQFCIPCYDINTNDIFIDGEMLDCNIDLIRMNFIKIQEIYLNG